MAQLLREAQDEENCDPNVGRFARDFCKVVPINGGDHAKVFRAQHKMDQQVYAVKAQVVANDSEQQVLLREVATLGEIWTEGMGCPTLLRYFGAWMEDGLLHVQTEPYECCLADRIHDHPQLSARNDLVVEEELLSLLRDTAAGLTALHSTGVAHTDVRPENILVTEQGYFKVGGLGHCRRLSEEAPTPVATLDCRYVAPEVLSREGAGSDLPLADVFSLALLACEFALSPMALATESRDWQQLRSGRLCEPLLRPLLSEPVLALLRRMLCSIPGERPSCAEISECASNLLRRSKAVAAPNMAVAQTALQLKMAKLRENIRIAEQVAAESKQIAEVNWLELKAMRSQKQVDMMCSVVDRASTPALQ